MLRTIGDYVDRFDVTRKELNNKEGKQFNIDTFSDKKQTTGNNYTNSIK
jgi:hypothetical protein